MAEKNIDAHVQPIDGKVIITFPEPINYLSLTPETANQFVGLIQDCIKALRNRERPPGTKPS